jgi:hypothetical protein
MGFDVFAIEANQLAVETLNACGGTRHGARCHAGSVRV